MVAKPQRPSKTRNGQQSEPSEDKRRALVMEKSATVTLDPCPLIILYWPWQLP